MRQFKHESQFKGLGLLHVCYYDKKSVCVGVCEGLNLSRECENLAIKVGLNLDFDLDNHNDLEADSEP